MSLGLLEDVSLVLLSLRGLLLLFVLLLREGLVVRHLHLLPFLVGHRLCLLLLELLPHPPGLPLLPLLLPEELVHLLDVPAVVELEVLVAVLELLKGLCLLDGPQVLGGDDPGALGEGGVGVTHDHLALVGLHPLHQLAEVPTPGHQLAPKGVVL